MNPATDEDVFAGEDVESGKLFEVPRVAITIDDSDPTVVKLVFAGTFELDRGNAKQIEWYNDLKAGAESDVTISVHVAGARKRHRRDSEGYVDAIVETKSLVVSDVYFERGRRERVTLIALTVEERAVAELVARRTQARVKTTGARNRLSGRVTTLAEEIDGVAATLAAAKYLNLYPTFLEGRGHCADVGLHYEVRSTRHLGGHLIVHREDPLGHRFVLVIVHDEGLYDVRGTLFGGAAARRAVTIDQYGHPGYWVPQRDLSEP